MIPRHRRAKRVTLGYYNYYVEPCNIDRQPCEWERPELRNYLCNDSKTAGSTRQSPSSRFVIFFLHIDHIAIMTFAVRDAGRGINIDAGVEKPSMDFGERS